MGLVDRIERNKREIEAEKQKAYNRGYMTAEKRLLLDLVRQLKSNMTRKELLEIYEERLKWKT